ncbi:MULTISPECIES: hypothetical protein [unclassified Streptomyces]|uniref:hypothetical protein n=1 Tax=unclassified Streptomyces TaxID=2593676 RepID=UPI003442689C
MFLVGDARDDVLDGDRQPLVVLGGPGPAGCRSVGLQFAHSGEGVAVHGKELPIALEVLAEVAAVRRGLRARREMCRQGSGRCG